MTNAERIAALAQDIYVNRHNLTNDVSGTELDDFISTTITWVNQFIPQIEKKADWNFMRTQNDTIGTITTAATVAYDIPTEIRKVVINPKRDLTIRQDGTVVSSFRLVNPNQGYDPSEPYDYRDRATQVKRQLIFSRELTESEVGGDIVGDTIGKIPKLSLTDVSLLDILDDENYDDIRQLFIMGVVKNQILPDIVQGGLTPTFALNYDRYLADCIKENNESADADETDRENFGWIGGV